MLATRKVSPSVLTYSFLVTFVTPSSRGVFLYNAMAMQSNSTVFPAPVSPLIRKRGATSPLMASRSPFSKSMSPFSMEAMFRICSSFILMRMGFL